MKKHKSKKSWVRDDGGRRVAGFKDTAPGDCVVRAIAIATRKPYREVHDAIAAAYVVFATDEGSNARDALLAAKEIASDTAGERGVNNEIWGPFLREQGWQQIRTTQGDVAPMWKDASLPPGRLVVQLYGHLVAVVDGIAHDTHDCVRGGRVRVYGYWQAASIADKINAAHAECEKSLRKSVEHAIRAGELLLEAKRTVGHGDWTAWLAENVKFSDRLAQAYMRLARLPVEKRNAVADLPLREALSAIRSRQRLLADQEHRHRPPNAVQVVHMDHDGRVYVGAENIPDQPREPPPVAPATPDEIADELIEQLQAAAIEANITDDHLRAAFERRFRKSHKALL